MRIFATDVDADAIAFARRGVYPASALADLPPDLVERYFNESTASTRSRSHSRHDRLRPARPRPARAVPADRPGAVSQRADLLHAASCSAARCSCSRSRCATAATWCWASPRRRSPLAEYFVLEQPRLKIYRRQGERALIPATRIRTPAPLMPPRRGARRPPRWPSCRRARARGPTAAASSASAARTCCCAADRRGRRRPPLRHPVDQHRGAACCWAFTARRSAKTSSTWRRACRRASCARRSTRPSAATAPRRPSPFTIGRAGRADRCPHARYPGTASTSDRLRTGRRGRDRPGRRRHLETERQASSRADRGQSGRERPLASSSAQRLTEATSELLEANQELTHRERRAAQRQRGAAGRQRGVQAATEEVETLNEELQATNEELETLNEELQATVEELNTTNDDLQARSIELQELAMSLEDQRRTSEAERARLQAVLASMPDAVALVDRGEADPRRFRRSIAFSGGCRCWISAASRSPRT